MKYTVDPFICFNEGIAFISRMNSARVLFVLLLSTVLVAMHFGDTSELATGERRMKTQVGFRSGDGILIVTKPKQFMKKKSKYFRLIVKQRVH